MKNNVFFILFLSLSYFKFMGQTTDYPSIIAHRGASGTAPENTIGAIKKALDIGADMIEIDIHQTKDGKLVVIHDESIDRTTDGKGKVCDLMYADIVKYSAGSWFSDDYKLEKVPTLEEVLRVIDGRAILLIEVKGDMKVYPNIEQKTIDLLKKENAFSWCKIQSFNSEIIETFHKLYPALEVYKLIVSEMFPFPFYYDEHISFGSLKKFTYTCGINPNFKFTSKRYVNKIHKMNQKVFCWTVNEMKDFERLKKIGVDGVITNFPERFVIKK